MQPRQTLIAILLLWLLGAALRITLLAVPPVIPVIQADLRLSGTEIGLCSAKIQFWRHARMVKISSVE